MKISIVAWETEPEHKVVRITDREMSTLSVTKIADEVALIWLRTDDRLTCTEAKIVAKALALAAKVAGYLDDLEPDAARDAILGMPTTPYNGWRPTPRAGRTENP